MYQIASERMFCKSSCVFFPFRLVTRDNRNRFRLYVDGKFHSMIATAWDRTEVAERHAKDWCSTNGARFLAATTESEKRIAYRQIGLCP